MSRKIDLTDPAVIARLLPALRQMVRFPTRSTKVVSFETGVELSELEAWVKVHGRPTVKALEGLERGQDRQANKRERDADVRRSLPTAPRSVTPPPVSARNLSPAPIEAPAPAAVRAVPPAPVPVAAGAPGSDLAPWLESQSARVTGTVTCFQVEVTPAIAAAWLKFNTGNRNPSKQKIRRFAALMESGRWMLNGETVKFSCAGRLIDGQSRLMAIELAQQPVVLEVRAGLPDTAQQSMDSGEIRKGAHMLEMLGEANPGVVAAALKLLWIWLRGWLSGFPFGVSRVMENGEVAPLLAAHAGLKISAGWAMSTGAKVELLLPRSEAVFFHYLLGTVDAAQRDQFFEMLVDGLGLTKTSAIYHLREQLLERRGGEDSQARKVLRRGLVIRGWNAWRSGLPCERLQFGAGDPFPDVAGLVTPATVRPVHRVPEKGVAA